MLKLFFYSFLICLLFFGMGGCGLQGPLEPPQSSQKGASADSQQEKDEKDDTKPKRTFFLDRFLR